MLLLKPPPTHSRSSFALYFSLLNMHRQSIGSPVSKLHSYGGGGAKEENSPAEDQKRKDQASSLTDDDEDNKSQKPQKSAPRLERFVHLIPVLTVLCFLILYLSSHDPSRKDLAQFTGFKQSAKPVDSTEIDDIGRFLEIKQGEVVAVRSLRNLHEIGRPGPKYRLHRKIGDF